MILEELPMPPEMQIIYGALAVQQNITAELIRARRTHDTWDLLT